MRDLEIHRKALNKLSRELRPIADFLDDPDVTDILLNPDGRIWLDTIDRGKFPTETVMAPMAAATLIGTVASLLGTIATEAHPVVEGELPIDGNRFEGLIPPIVSNPVFAIRKKALLVFTLSDYVEKGSMTPEQQGVIETAISDRLNILVCGGTASGKTTFTNALLNTIKERTPDHRVVIIEDTIELQSKIADTVALRTTEEISMTNLLRYSLRLRPDRIIVGEVRGPEALDLLMAWNTGHPGGLGTIHADSASEALDRLAELITLTGAPPMHGLINRVVDIVVSLQKVNGQRKITEILQVHKD
ncbi:P-type conjugative transfer ATPase TrbB [Acidithiobacillus thiooxidans]|uniref:P-type conjugative transfer ATPase TrbB n=1 Tax=Acidithiobacillus thiooxidans TaxID=930 RepID=UPI001C06EC38|nr:P-type conjugative transfer ATPase TrbB [Acidithiobacillus thiooxidans]MBU2834421.1 P-type conjugative transfer ATPase TrbB [Acidithiobacillus thiooxidans]